MNIPSLRSNLRSENDGARWRKYRNSVCTIGKVKTVGLWQEGPPSSATRRKTASKEWRLYIDTLHAMRSVVVSQ